MGKRASISGTETITAVGTFKKTDRSPIVLNDLLYGLDRIDQIRNRNENPDGREKSKNHRTGSAVDLRKLKNGKELGRGV